MGFDVIQGFRRVGGWYSDRVRRLRIIHMKNGYVIAFALSLLVSWLVFMRFFFFAFDYPGRFAITFVLGWCCAMATLRIARAQERSGVTAST